MSKVIVYATHTCTYCHMIADWLKNKGVDHEMKFIDTDAAAADELNEKLQGNIPGVPITIIDNNSEQAVFGFDREAITEQLATIGITIPADEEI